jgi:hypothetical protein
MKTKKFSKKLALNKKTIADLNNGQLGLVKGGIIPESVLCTPVCLTDTCNTQCGPFTFCDGFTCYPKCPTYTCDGICN